MAAKTALRRHLRSMLSTMSATDRETGSAKACRLLCEQPEYTQAEVVMVFLSLPTEVDTTSLVLRCWQDHKRVLAPKISWEQRRILPVEIRSLTDDLAPSRFGVREPVSGVPFPLSLLDLVVVPGLGFDALGNRLGRGSGFYDRFLSNADFTGVSCALAFEIQVVGGVPVGPLDRSVDMLVTDQKVRRFTQGD